MKIVVASDSYKGCLSSAQVAVAMQSAILAAHPEAHIVKVSVADGGEGTVEALVDSLGGTLVETEVSDPLGRRIMAKYGKAGDMAVMEVASACGLTLLRPVERNPLVTSTRGVGEMILDALSRGCRRFLVGLGGSATNDGGKGMTDYALHIYETTGVDVRNMPGAGAAGGLGGAFKAFLGATLRPGVDMVLDAVDFDSLIAGADLVITGEGRSDFQTPKCKTPSGVLARAKKQGIPVALVSGSVESCPEFAAMGFASIHAATPDGMSPEEAMKPEVAAKNIFNTVTGII